LDLVKLFPEANEAVLDVNEVYAVLLHPGFVTVQFVGVEHGAPLCFAYCISDNQPERRAVTEELGEVRCNRISTNDGVVIRLRKCAIGREERTCTQGVSRLPGGDEFVYDFAK
jgi:hypothetical protein